MDYVVVAGIDPFFMEETQETARLCVKHKVPYVTIDCHHTDYLHQNSAINVVSKECLSEHYKGIKKEEVFEKLISTTDGLVIITTGQNDMIFGRKSTGIHYMPVFKTDAKSTLGAGDTFKAGCIYGLLHDFTDEETVRFASAAKAQALFIRKYGKEELLRVQTNLHQKYIFSKVQEILGQDIYEGLGILEENRTILSTTILPQAPVHSSRKRKVRNWYRK